MLPTKTARVLCVLLAASDVSVVPVAVAGTSCAGIDAYVETESADLATRLCALIEGAVSSLADCQLDVPLPVRVDVRSSLEHGCLGLYHCDTSRIDVLDPAAFGRAVSDEGPFGRSRSRDTTIAS